MNDPEQGKVGTSLQTQRRFTVPTPGLTTRVVSWIFRTWRKLSASLRLTTILTVILAIATPLGVITKAITGVHDVWRIFKHPTLTTLSSAPDNVDFNALVRKYPDGYQLLGTTNGQTTLVLMPTRVPSSTSSGSFLNSKERRMIRCALDSRSIDSGKRMA